MSNDTPLLTTALACKVTRLDRDRLNEAISAGILECVPSTVAGRARKFAPDDLLPLWLYREMVEAGTERSRAGRIACRVAQLATEKADAKAIAWVETYVGAGFACLPQDVPAVEDWDRVVVSGSDIRRVTFHRIDKARAMIAHATEEELRTFGPED